MIPSSTVTPGVELHDLTIGYTRRRALRRGTVTEVASGLSAVARRGELTALVGPNGAGKSTLLRTLCGLQPALRGRVLIDGEDVATVKPADLATRISVVLTERIDPGLLTVRELVALGRTPHLPASARLSPEDLAAVDEALEAVGATRLASRQFSELSDGQRQRSLTARALAQDPSLLVLDEPTSFLDVPSRVELVDVLGRLAREQNLAVVMSTHELELALRVADRMWLLGTDRTLTCDTPAALAESGRIGAAFDRGRMRFDSRTMVFDLKPEDSSV
ncbi:ABC transporter ATP-binding protein [Rhodococcus rhodochrous]|uniref:ABC transporter ATP-binding protein n=1 Tax=Rhodococcus rhodochrous TaxID=1829 RepID=UPI001CE27549|nr:ABC transporter ATP-binding protein [Rhodococcus rhodochrous]